MRDARLLLCAVTAIAILGCGRVKSHALRISAGDDKDRVIQVMGTPDDRQFSGQQEAWQYGMVVSVGVCDYTIIWFNQGKVSGLTSYRGFSTMGCRQGLKAINWEQAPDRIIEFRQR